MLLSWVQVLFHRVKSWWAGQLQRQKIILNTGWLLADRCLRMVVGLLVGVWVARYLGPEQFGLFSYAAAIVYLFGTISALGGLDGIVVRDIICEPAGHPEILGTAFTLRFIAGGITFLLALGTGLLLGQREPQALTLIALIAAGQLLLAFDTIDFWFQAKVQSKYTVYAKSAAFLTMSAVRVALILAQASLIAFAVAALVEVALGAGLLVLFYRKAALQSFNWKVSGVRARALLSLSWPLILAGGASAVYMKIDQVMLGNMLGANAVGIYSAATKVTEVWSLIPLAIMSSIYPSLIGIHQVSQGQYYERWGKVLRAIFWASVLMSAVIAVLSHTIVVGLYGESYAQAADVVAIHSYAGIGMSVSAVLNYHFALQGKTKISLYGTVLGALANVGANIVLIRSFEVRGAALASVLGYMLVPLFQVMICDKETARAFFRALLGSWSEWNVCAR